MKIIDTNVLLYVVNRLAPHHGAITQWWTAATNDGEPLGFTWVTLLGFVRMATNPRVFARPLSVRQAVDQVSEWLALPTARIVQESPDHWKVLAQLLATVGTAGNLTTDAHLAALALHHGATLVSCDADFLKFRQVRFENPISAS